MYPSSPTPISDTFWDSFEQPNVAPATMDVDLPEAPIYAGGGEQQGPWGGVASMGAQVGGAWLGNEAKQAGGFGKLMHQWGTEGSVGGDILNADTGYKGRQAPTDNPNAFGGLASGTGAVGPVSKQSVLGQFMAPTHAITPQVSTPMAMAPALAASPTIQGTPGLMEAATAGGAGSLMPAVGPALNLAQGKKKTAGLGLLGTVAGAPFGPPGMLVGGMLGSALGGGK